MPRHLHTGGADFKFDLAAPDGWAYAPGDTIIGNLMRQNPIVTPEAIITLSFTGRVKVKFIYQAQYNRHVYSDSWELLHVESVIFQGPLHLAKLGDQPLTWPISVDIPYYRMKSCKEGSPNCCFFALDADHPSYHILPGSFHSEGHKTGAFDSVSLSSPSRCLTPSPFHILVAKINGVERV